MVRDAIVELARSQRHARDVVRVVDLEDELARSHFVKQVFDVAEPIFFFLLLLLLLQRRIRSHAPGNTNLFSREDPVHVIFERSLEMAVSIGLKPSLTSCGKSFAG